MYDEDSEQRRKSTEERKNVGKNVGKRECKKERT
jgi:hypothetical protein